MLEIICGFCIICCIRLCMPGELNMEPAMVHTCWIRVGACNGTHIQDQGWQPAAVHASKIKVCSLPWYTHRTGMGIGKSAGGVLSLNGWGPGAAWAPVGCPGGQRPPAENEFGYSGDQFAASQCTEIVKNFSFFFALKLKHQNQRFITFSITATNFLKLPT